MRLHWAELGVTLAMVMTGCAVTGWLLLRRLGRDAAERQLMFEHELIALDDALRAVETRLAAMQSPAERAAEPAAEPIAPEIRAVIAASAVATLGPRARVRSVRSLDPEVSAWTQQGRVSVQSSHNVRPGRQAPRSAPERES